MRDEFSQPTKEKLAKRAGYRCSKPDCGIPTIGAASDDDGIINIGFAAHITAAAPGGPRYDPALTSEKRKDYKNGIWLCGTHAKLVDSDKSYFTVEELLSWKRQAERRSFLEVVSSKPISIGAQLSDEEEVQKTIALLLEHAKSDLTAFQRMAGWPDPAIALNLKTADEKYTDVFTASGLASAIEVFDEIAVIAPPGTGKTTTLMQLTEAVIDEGSCVAVFVPLSEWSTGSETFFQSIVRRRAFRKAREIQFELLAEHGRLVLILDGWNELDVASKRRARTDVNSLRRDYPDIRLVMSSRYKDFDLPIKGPVVEVDVLTEAQQLEIAKTLRGLEGESLMDHAWRTPGLRELVSIPLYLTAFLKHDTGGSIPTTKEELLRYFVSEIEQDPEKIARLREELQGFHRYFLEYIAFEAMLQQTVALSEAKVRSVITIAQEHLKENKQITQLLQPMKVIDILVNAHMLVRPRTESDNVSFQHQQFQEWFASFRVQQLMLSATSGDKDARKTFREDVLDIRVCEEAILFACERLSHMDQSGIQAVANAILETLGIDPLLSAEMIYRSSDEVWKQIRKDVLSFAEKWHAAECVDRAVRFMIDTGRAEFSQYIWPLISNPDNQVHLRALRSGRRFRPNVLGPDIQKRVAEFPIEVRKNVVSEIAVNSDMDGIELATLIAKNDTSSEVKNSVIESLLFRRADRFIKDILMSAPDDVWHSLAIKWHPHEFADPQISARMEKEVSELYVAETDPLKILNTFLRQNDYDPGKGVKICELIKKIDFSEKSKYNAGLIYRAKDLYPDDVARAFIFLLESGKPVPFGTADLLLTSNIVIDEGHLIDYVLQDSGDVKTTEIAVSVIGPKTAGKLIDQLFRIDARIRADNGKYDESLNDNYHRLSDWISKTKTNSFFHAVLERTETENTDEIALLCSLISRHGASDDKKTLRIDASTHERLTLTVRRWSEILLTSKKATRAQFAEIAQAAERLRSPSLVPVLQELLSEDLSRRKQALKELDEARKNRLHIVNDAHMSWNHQYRCAFAAIGDDQTVQIMKAYLPNPDFGFDAAHVLKAVWRKSQPPEEKPGFFKSWPDFSVVPEEYKKRQSGTVDETHPFVNDILAVVDDLIRSDTEDAYYRHALKLATVAFSMPYVNKTDTITTLLQIPLPAIDKQDLLTVLVLSGETIPSNVVIEGINELLEKANTNPWMIGEQNGFRLDNWLRLLSFTEAPGSILDVLNPFKKRLLNPRNLHGVLSALGYAPSNEAENVLNELAKRDKRFLSKNYWLIALSNRNTLTAAEILLNLICDASFSSEVMRIDRRDYGKKLSGFMTSHELFRKEVYKRFPCIAEGPAKSVLEYAIADAADTEGVLLLVRDGAAQGKSFRATSLHTALQKVLIGTTPIESSGMQQLYSLPAHELRRNLFDILIYGNTKESKLAAECLSAIDEIRDDYGWVYSEPRHPNISTGVPWPLIDFTKPTST